MILIDMNNQVTVSPKYDQIYNFLYNCISEYSVMASVHKNDTGL